jgi:hypothetical protein
VSVACCGRTDDGQDRKRIEFPLFEPTVDVAVGANRAPHDIACAAVVCFADEASWIIGHASSMGVRDYTDRRAG